MLISNDVTLCSKTAALDAELDADSKSVGTDVLAAFDDRLAYGAIVADPPWTFKTWSDIPASKRSILNHYQTMPLAEIKALPVADYAARDCALFLWTTDTHLPQALEVVAAWGFAFKTIAFNWVKQTSTGKLVLSCGWWTRGGSELCILSTRGKPKRLARDVRRVVMAPVREHSRKPDVIYETHIPRLVAGPYLELFARTRRHGWDVAMSDQPDLFG
jgi:N6-adenosine-specific RNA methylase IME4